MPILDIQKRSRELGRIRLGQKTANGAPTKLDRFRLTSASQPLLEKVAELYGGEVQPWTPAGGSPAFEVITASARLPIMVPPQPVSQWYEFWTRAGCQHRCDGRTNVLTDELCDPEDPKHLEAMKKPTTRLNVVLRDVEGIGVWRVETHGWNAAVELPDVAEFLAQAGGYVNGWLALEQRTSVEQTDQGPKTRHFAVPIIEIDVTPAQLLAGGGRVAAPTLEGPVPVAAIEAPAEPAPQVVIPTPEQVAAMNADLAAKTIDYLERHGAGDHPATHAVRARLAQLTPQPDADGVVDAVIVEDPPTPAAAPAVEEPNPDAIWQQIVATAGRLGMTTSQVQADCAARLGGVLPEEASGTELGMYLKHLETVEANAGEGVPA